MNDTKQHSALITIKVEVHEILTSGEFSGQPVKLKDYPEYKINSIGFVKIDGYDLDNCLLKVKQAIERLKNGTN